jgi:hypothetical protein
MYFTPGFRDQLFRLTHADMRVPEDGNVSVPTGAVLHSHLKRPRSFPFHHLHVCVDGSAHERARAHTWTHTRTHMHALTCTRILSHTHGYARIHECT